MSDSHDTSISTDDWGFDAIEARPRHGRTVSADTDTGDPTVSAETATGGPTVSAETATGGLAAPAPRGGSLAGSSPAASTGRLAGRVWERAVAMPHRGTVLTLLFFAGWSLLLAFPYFGFGSMSYVVLHDTAEMNLPRAIWYGSPAAETGMGSWAPMAVSGNDRLASGLSTDLDTLLFMVFPGWLAYGLFMWLQRFVAGYFLYRLLREWKNVTPLAAAAVSCAYALFTQPHINMGWAGFALYDGLALPGLPLALYVLFRSARWRARYRYPVVVAAGLFFALSSHFFLALFGVLAVCIVALVAFPCRDRKYFWVAPLLFAGAWFAGEMPVLWAAAANAGLSHRGDRALLTVNTQGGVAYRSWLPKFLNDNWLALALTMLAMLAAALRRSWRVLAVAGIAAVCVLLVVWAPFLRDNVFAHLGPLSGFRFDRLFVVLPFLTLLAGGLGLGLLPRLSPSFAVGGRGLPGWWRERNGRDDEDGSGRADGSGGRSPGRRYRVPIQALVGLAILLGVTVEAVTVQARIGGEMAKGATYESLYGSPQIEELAAGQRRDEPFRVASVNAPLGRDARDAWHPGYAWAYGLETADGYSVLYSQRYQDFWLRVIDAKVGRSKEIMEYYQRWGNRVYLFASRNYLKNPLGIMPSKRWNLSLLSLANVEYFISPVKLRDDSLTLLPWGRRAEQARWLTLSPGERREVAGRGEFPGLPLYVYRNEQVFPRAFLVERAAVFERQYEVLNAMAAAGVGGLRGAVYLTAADAATLGLAAKPLPAGGQAEGGGASTGAAEEAADAEGAAEEIGGAESQAAAPADDAVLVISYEADEIALRVTAAKRSVLIVTNSFSRYWKARVDGEEVPLAPADHTFLGVVVPKGEHEVTLSYEPTYGFLGWQ